MFTYCPGCGHKDTVTTSNETEYKCSDCGWITWNNAKATVAILFVKDGKLLVSKRAIEPMKGQYDLPGGFVDFAEGAYDAVIREAYEETGIKLQPEDIELIDAYKNRYLPTVSTIDMIFWVHRWEGEFVPSDDSEELVWKDPEFINDPKFAAPYPALDLLIKERLSKSA
jgi:ADP-ribose pyrophosphatase YjhB (NUDIX family)